MLIDIILLKLINNLFIILLKIINFLSSLSISNSKYFIYFKIAMWFIEYSFNSFSEKDLNISSNLINLFFNVFNAFYLSLFSNLIICTLVLLLFFVVYILFLFSSIIVNETFGLLVSNSLGDIPVKLYLFLDGFSFDILSGWK